MKNFAMEMSLQGNPALFMVREEYLGNMINNLGALQPDAGVVRIVPEHLWLEGDDRTTRLPNVCG